MADLTTIEAKLDLALQLLGEIKAAPPPILSAPAAAVPAWQHPPITAEQAVIDGKTINVDGSIWTWDETGRLGGQPGVKFPVGLAYGYFSREKDPETFAKLEAAFGESFRAWYEERDPWAIYKVNIKPMVDAGTVNWLNFSWLMQPFSRYVQ